MAEPLGDEEMAKLRADLNSPYADGDAWVSVDTAEALLATIEARDARIAQLEREAAQLRAIAR